MKSIIIDQISKSFGKNPSVPALSSVSLSVEQGKLFGLIGPDGAGKTTLFRILTTLLLPDSGNAQVEGLDVVGNYKEIRKIVGYMPGKFSLYQDLSVAENLHFFATIFNTTVQENYHLIRDIYIQLEPFKNRMAGKLSGGMKQKLALCCALIHEPAVLFLDEPTTGVDAVSRREFWEMLKKLQKNQITIFVSTPYMDEANMCDEIAFIQDSKIMSVDTPENIINAYTPFLWAIKTHDMYRALRDLKEKFGKDRCQPFGEFHHLSFIKTQVHHEHLLQFLSEKNHTGIKLKKIRPTIEDCFLHQMQQNVQEKIT